jgi:glycosyltransferase involved in cell wall biosynthesis
VLVATHNRPGLLRQALASVVEQSMPDWEVVLVDDGSTPPANIDTLPEHLQQRIQLIRHPQPRRSAAARNTAVRAARGDVLAFLDDDDLLHPGFLDRALGVLDRHPAVEVVCIGVSWFGQNADWTEKDCIPTLERTLAEAGGTEIEPGVLSFGPDLLGALVRRVPMAFQQQVVRREVFERIGFFTEGRVLDRSDWGIRAAAFAHVALCPEGLYRQRCDGQSYASRPERIHEFLLAGVDTMETLLERLKRESAPQRAVLTVSCGAAKSWFDLAYWCRQQGRYREAWHALAMSERREPSLPRLRLAARMAVDGLQTVAGRPRREN